MNPEFEKELKRLVAIGDHAKALLAEVSGTNGAVAAKTIIDKDTDFPELHRNGTDKILPTVRRNCDAAYEILIAAGRPLQRDDLLERMTAVGKTSLTKGTSLAFYLRQDKKRFKTAGKGMWKAIQ